MEPSHHVARGMNRWKQTPLLMTVTLVISMAFVFVWTSGMDFNVAEPGTNLKRLELQINRFESRSFPNTGTQVDDEKTQGYNRSANHDLPNLNDSSSLNVDFSTPRPMDRQRFEESKTETESASALDLAAPLESLQRSNEDTAMVVESKQTASFSDEDAKIVANDNGRGPDYGLNETVTESTAASDQVETKWCDYTVGKWVPDKMHPLYSGYECPTWLSFDFACRRHNHPNKQMDQYRWQPKICSLPTFNASAALEMLRNQVVAFVGDSLGRQQWQSLMCMLTSGKNTTSISEVGSKFNFYIPHGERKPTGYAYRFDITNTTIIFKWSSTLTQIQTFNKSKSFFRNVVHLDRPEEFLQDHLHQVHVLVLNSGHWWNNFKVEQHHLEFFNNGELVPKSSSLSNVSTAYNQTIHTIVKWIHRQSLALKAKQVIYYRSLSPEHFQNGKWNTGGTCDMIQFEKGKQVREGKKVDAIAESAIAGTNVKLLNITSLSLERGETHVSKYGAKKDVQDCLHWCLPGIPDTWNEILLAELGAKFQPR